jgi:hypothetical protein
LPGETGTPAAKTSDEPRIRWRPITITNPDVARLIDEQLNTGRYTSADEVLLAGLKLLQQRENGTDENISGPPHTDQITNLATLAAECTRDIPDSEWDKIPTDFGQNHDHYLYGTPKRHRWFENSLTPFYWLALLSGRDALHQKAIELSNFYQPRQIVTSEMV